MIRLTGILMAAVGCWLAGGHAARPARADESGLQLAVGFGGTYRSGSWTPLVVTSAAGAAEPIAVGERLHVWVEDPDGQFVRSPPVTAVADAAGRAAARCCVRFGRPSGRVRVERGTRMFDCRVGQPVPATERVLLVCGDLPAAGRAVRLVDGGEGPRQRLAVLRDVVAAAAGIVAPDARDFDGVDAIVLCGRGLAEFADATLEQIDGWVRRGGRLVLLAGGSAKLIGDRKPAGSWLPGRVERFVTLRRFGPLEAYARAGRLTAAATAAEVPVFADPQSLPGMVEAFDGNAPTDLPLVIRRSHGLGTITWLGIDLDMEPFRSWPGADSLLLALLDARPRSGGAAPVVDATQRPPDLAGQLRVALERFATGRLRPRIGHGSFELVAAVGLLYVLCLFPLDWWLVSRGGGRPWLAWVSLPLLVAGFTALAWGLRPAPADGEAVREAAQIVDIDAAGDLVRGGGWAAVFATDNERLAVAAAGEDAAVSWLADAGRGFGGLDAAMPQPSLAASDYAYGETLAALDAVPIAAVSTRLFEAGWSAPGQARRLVTTTLAREPQGTLRGTIAHHLPCTLERSWLAYGGWRYDVGRLAPGTTFDLAVSRGPRSLAGALTLRSAAKERDVSARWNPTETDVSRILEVAGFHAAAGGSGYTGLRPGRLERFDLSPLIAVDRAVLVGFVAAAETPLRVSGVPIGGPAMYRIVVPLEQDAEPSR
jgi:hypothetical protein